MEFMSLLDDVFGRIKLGELDIDRSAYEMLKLVAEGDYVFRADTVTNGKSTLFEEVLLRIQTSDQQEPYGPLEIFNALDLVELKYEFYLYLLEIQLDKIQNEMPEGVSYSVNVHPHLFEREHGARLMNILSQYASVSDRVWIEITEFKSLSGQFDDLWNVWSLQKMGFQVAFDDYGDPAGYHRPWMLRFVEPQAVKFTQEAVDMLLGKTPMDPIVQEGYSECMRLGAIPVAEAVLSGEERDRLMQEFKIEFIQYHG
ncbi:MAG: EAL domain-containing protein [Alphaproteobacteria bacterium]|nr:EAL domain-containing protein [Alphaproteobacteria bacterium]